MIVTGCNGKPGMMHIVDEHVQFIETGDTRGACFVGTTLFYLTKQGLNMQRQGEHPALIHKSNRDWHGLHRAPDCLLAPDPVTDLIHEFTLTGVYVGAWKWKSDADGRHHTNDCCVEGSDLYLSCFTRGIVRNGEPLGTGRNLQPHSVTRHGGLTYYCGSNLGEVMREGDLWITPGGFTRGLLATPNGLWVGSSAQRRHAGGSEAEVNFYNWDGDHVTRIPLPTNEVYAITTPEIGT